MLIREPRSAQESGGRAASAGGASTSEPVAGARAADGRSRAAKQARKGSGGGAPPPAPQPWYETCMQARMRLCHAGVPLAALSATQGWDPGAFTALMPSDCGVEVTVVLDCLSALADYGFALVAAGMTRPHAVATLFAFVADVLRMPPTYAAVGLRAAARLGDAHGGLLAQALTRYLNP